jgi:NAD(P)H-hydrate repair Nnr-like enzyme with NAD(P)H-hydrate dehydratase domain
LTREAAEEAVDLIGDADALLLGPGMAEPGATKAFVTDLLEHANPKCVVVLDALAVSCGVLDSGLGDLAERTVVTPNRAEAEYLIDNTAGDDAALAVRIAQRHRVTTVLGSCVATSDGECWIIPKGNAGLGTSGSGDVLAGAVTGIAARTQQPVMAAAWGLTLHGTAGDRLAARVGQVGFLAREILDELPGCVQTLTSG